MILQYIFTAVTCIVSCFILGFMVGAGYFDRKK